MPKHVQGSKHTTILPFIIRLFCDLLLMLSITTSVNLFATELTTNFTVSANSQHTESSIGLASKSELIPSINFTAFLGATKKFDGLKQESLQNGLFGIEGSFKISDYFLLLPAARLIAPLNEDQRELDSFRGAVNLATGVNFKRKKTNIAYVITARANSYKYVRAHDGKYNPYFGLTNTVSASYKLGSFIVRGSLSNTHQWNHYTARLNDRFAMEESITFKANQKLYFTLGHRNGGNTFAANGTDPNMEIFDADTSLIYTTLNYQL